MSDEHPHPEEGEPGMPPPAHTFSQDFQHSPVAARVPEKVGRGVFSTATMILQTHDQFVMDFLSTIVQPQQVVARVVMTPSTFSQFVAALRMDIGKYEQYFGPLLPKAPPPQGPRPVSGPAAPSGTTAAAAPPPEGEQAAARQSPPGQPSIGELYDQLKLPDELLGGAFANVVMIRHTPEEFCFDFIASFYPRSVVTNRIFLAAARAPSLLEAMSNSLWKFQQAAGGRPPAPEGPASF